MLACTIGTRNSRERGCIFYKTTGADVAQAVENVRLLYAWRVVRNDGGRLDFHSGPRFDQC